MPETQRPIECPLPVRSAKTKAKFVNLSPPGRLDMEFLLEAAKGLRFGLNGNQTPCNRTSGRRELADTFIGVCLAAPRDLEATQATMALLEELGVKSVRIDFSEASTMESLLPLLRALNEARIAVLLHLVQALEQARQMPAQAAVEAWGHFVQESLAQASGLIEAVEIGTTINRAKWSGYSLEGFLAAWAAAFPLVKESGLLLVGPNVTDFEPQYNAGVLGMLKRRGLLPEIHSNNMFAERAIEPEALDRKILGESMKGLHGYDLIKKLRLVAAIGRRNGIQRNWSSCAFWTLPRIERILASPEEQMADYLVRYFVLCASEGTFERFYWGPLVSQREGLLDDGMGLPEDRTVRDVVADYREMPGAPGEWRRRAAFYAFKMLHRQLSGAGYVGRLCGRKGLEVHAFNQGEAHFHVVWTKNGSLACAAEVYAKASLGSIRAVYSRDGELLPGVPKFFSESPVYLCWEPGTAIAIQPAAKLMPQVVAARAQDGFRYYDYQTETWRGLVYARSGDEADRLIAALKPDSLGTAPADRILRDARNAIWTVEHPLAPGQSLVVKKPVRVAWHKRILDRTKPSKAVRSWNGTSQLMRRGIETPKVVAYFEHRDPKRVLDNWFICEHAQTRLSVRRFFIAYAKGEERVEGFSFEAFASELVDFIRTVHSRGVYFRDLSGGNVLVRIEADNRLVFSLIDTARARFANQRFSRSQRVADLKRLAHKLDPERQAYFMTAYLEKEKAAFTAWQRLSFKLYAFKASLKRMKRKARKAFG
ncbi:MAG: hypothetical protein EA353_08855 [Puniceicoccaceae bacterium]|nr:MAG: hypothetical protein EA353_08855 [Puniceicoccaceae bacterium]